jgi:glycogen operon protein
MPRKPRTSSSSAAPSGPPAEARAERADLLVKSALAGPLATSATAPPTFRGRPLTVSRGFPQPYGAANLGETVNFVVISQHATALSLVLCETCTEAIEAEIPLDPAIHRTGHLWHVRVAGLPDDFCYGFRADGPRNTLDRFDPSVVLLDPAARALSCGRPWGVESRLPRRCLMVPTLADRHDGDAPGPRPPRIAREDTILYELHVRGFTVSPSSGVEHPGTYLGLAEKLDHLTDLGITGVELLPIDEFDENDCPFSNPLTGQRHRNFWGYNTIAFGAPKAAYASNPDGVEPWNELRSMVQALHERGIEVVLDVVFNHTAEGRENGPTLSFRGLDNSLYYMLDDQGRYLNYSGCGNTFNGNHPITSQLLLSCLYSLVAEAEIDGFRFDLASVLGRDRRGHVLVEPPVITRFTHDALLADTKLIAEPWDAGGLYQVDNFPGGGRWGVWNGRYRDDVRKFWRGDMGQVGTLANRICGSNDLFPHLNPLHSVNFITCHDGFTLNDLVSYNQKHNEANGEGNRDGSNDNYSWNCGTEGPTDDPAVLALRNRQARNLFATLMLSQGVPMILGGDEFLRSQNGNNNAWCQDNPIGWVDWTDATRNADFLRFARALIALRKRHPVLRRRTFFRGKTPTGRDIIWHGTRPERPDFTYASRTIAFALDGRGTDRSDLVDRDLYVAMNAYWEPLAFTIPAAPTGRRWRLAVDTGSPAPSDVHEPDQGPIVRPGRPIMLEGRSLVVLVSEA